MRLRQSKGHDQCATRTKGVGLQTIWCHFLWPDSVGVRKAPLDALVKAAGRFSTAIHNGLLTSLREAMSELINIATGKNLDRSSSRNWR